ncbi:MAG: 1-acyl-sn-glycerol-3-phosphate acyltransferase [Granulosicoccus sp.]|jgi:1-acyl-sn-glycerol-3-phosphate acyltransferase
MLKLIARIILRLGGWKVDTNIPKESNRSVMIAAPHTSNWDGIWVRVAFAILGIPVKIAVKDIMTKFPLGLITKPLGFLGINRSKKNPNKPRKSQIEQMADFFQEFDEIAMVIAPEGTRALRKEWKLGFYYVAKMAKVPITFGYLDFEKKVAGVGGVLYPTDNLEADMKKIMAFYKNISPKYASKYSLDQRYV